MGSALFGSSKETSELPPWLQESAEAMLDRSEALGQTGYMPYGGGQVAALSPLQYAAMQNTAAAANAFGMATPQAGGDINAQSAPIDLGQFAEGEQRDKAARISKAYRDVLGRDPDTAGFQYWMSNVNPDSFESNFRSGISNPETMDPLTGLAMPGQFGGVRGYSSMPQYNDQMAFAQQNAPGQMDYYNSFFIDPQTGAPGANTSQLAQQAAGMGGILAQDNRDFGGAADHGYGGVTARGGNNVSGFSPGDGGFLGYSGVGDMFDGGGRGKSGPEFGGMFGGVSNGLGASPSGSGVGWGGGGWGGLW